MIGVLVGAQREHSKLSPNLGIREFVLCAAVAAACGLQHSAAISAVALASLIIALMAFRHRTPMEESGFTTDLAMLTVFCLS
ncbi:MAG: MgtC/SapB family protein, partial [Candidatus Obscuribacterales bacterium]|nr:MgtC/SapB family protein [Candidatus Obscuribacterales bacterium]